MQTAYEKLALKIYSQQYSYYTSFTTSNSSPLIHRRSHMNIFNVINLFSNTYIKTGNIYTFWYKIFKEIQAEKHNVELLNNIIT